MISTSREQFRESLLNPVVRRNLGFDLNDEQAEWFVSEAAALEAVYLRWKREGGPASRATSAPVAPLASNNTSASNLQLPPPPTYRVPRRFGARLEKTTSAKVISSMRALEPSIEVTLSPGPCHIVAETHAGILFPVEDSYLLAYRCQLKWWGRTLTRGDVMNLRGPLAEHHLQNVEQTGPPTFSFQRSEESLIPQRHSFSRNCESVAVTGMLAVRRSDDA